LHALRFTRHGLSPLTNFFDNLLKRRMLKELKYQWEYTLKGSENLIILRNTQTGRIRPVISGF